MEGHQGGKKQSQKQREKALFNHNWNVTNANMHKNAKMFELNEKGEPANPAQPIVSYLDEAEWIKFVPELIKLQFDGHKIVKDVCTECPWNKNIEIIDLKLDVFGPREDDYYSALPILTKNIRRGNTILKVHDNKAGTVEYFIGRKGVMKFFDLRLPYISAQERNALSTKNYKENAHQEKNYILAPALKAIVEGHEVEVFKTLKANGENVQISYNKPL